MRFMLSEKQNTAGRTPVQATGQRHWKYGQGDRWNTSSLLAPNLAQKRYPVLAQHLANASLGPTAADHGGSQIGKL